MSWLIEYIWGKRENCVNYIYSHAKGEKTALNMLEHVYLTLSSDLLNILQAEDIGGMD